ncbi:hypothetical protein GcM1_201030 [Golovinomyces cichoracearum]|uniref:Stress-associated endoplasmic reticulum protein n=1 Tax=Golovinomyces cichoracearum TaxID=62708 RepID=A0A420IYA6_9PEZI|nr:hypothetical protein GcM1_201030 [Golovinomyces cichoracearum]
MVQTPEQRKRNERFAKQQNAKRGKPAVEPKTKLEFKSPLNPILAADILSHQKDSTVDKYNKADMVFFSLQVYWRLSLLVAWRSN